MLRYVNINISSLREDHFMIGKLSPKVRVVFKRGSDLTQYHKGSIPFGDRNVLFA